MSSSPAKRSADGNLPRRVAKAARAYVAAAEDRGDELNRETLLKRNRCFIKASNKELQAFVQEKENPPVNGSSVGGPYYQYANAVAEYIRNMRETEKRYGGETGAIICFGNNEGFQQGRGDEEKANEQSADDRLPRQYIWGSLSKKMIRQVAAGGMHAAVLTDDGQVFTWGTGDDGALGRGRLPQEVDGDDAPAVHQATATAVKGFLTKDGIQEDGKICQVSAGASHVHFLSFAGNVYMTGMYKDNDSGKFHMPRPGQSCRGGTFTPNHIWELPSPIVMICSGGNFGAAITQERSLLTWGLGNCGELSRSGDNKGHDLIYDQVYNKETKKKVYNLMSHNYKNDEGQYDASAVYEKFLTPKSVYFADKNDAKLKILNVSAGEFHLMVVGQKEGEQLAQLYTAGLNQYKQLGLTGFEGNECHFLTKVDFFKDQNVGQICAGQHHSLALTANGDLLYAWGRADSGQLGIGKQTVGEFYGIPQRVPMPRGTICKKLAAGDTTSMVLTSNEELYSWGFEGYGHEGEGDVVLPRRIVLPDVTQKVFHMDAGAQFGVLVAETKQKKLMKM